MPKVAIALALSSLVFLCAGCGGDPLEHSQWVADMSTVQWGEAGNSVVRPNNYWRVNLGADGDYRENYVLAGTAGHPSGTYEVTSHEGDDYTVHVTISEVESFDLQISSGTMTYTREAAVGTITATMPCNPSMCPD